MYSTLNLVYRLQFFFFVPRNCEAGLLVALFLFLVREPVVDTNIDEHMYRYVDLSSEQSRTQI